MLESYKRVDWVSEGTSSMSSAVLMNDNVFERTPAERIRIQLMQKLYVNIELQGQLQLLVTPSPSPMSER